MTTTFLKKTKGLPCHEALGQALREAGVGVVEVEDWDEAAEELRKCEAALVVCNGELDTHRLKQAISALTGNGGANVQAMAPEAARALSHDLRTPLSAMAGWVHLMESGKLDEAGLKRAISKLRGNIEDQVRVIERHLGNGQPRGTSPT
jgi:signal transduction histidine kinase